MDKIFLIEYLTQQIDNEKKIIDDIYMCMNDENKKNLLQSYLLKYIVFFDSEYKNEQEKKCIYDEIISKNNFQFYNMQQLLNALQSLK